MPDFVPGLELSRLFFLEAVKPVLDADFPRLRYAAARIHTGSEVLGFDTEMSADHGWGPRVDLYLDEADDAARNAVDASLRAKLPHRFRGHSTSFTEPDAADHGTQRLVTKDGGPVRHKVDFYTVRGFLQIYLAFDPARDVEPADWLTFPEQALRTITHGAVYHDEVGLEEVRRRLAYYPRDVWLYLLAAAWGRIGQEEHLMGRAGLVGASTSSATARTCSPTRRGGRRSARCTSDPYRYPSPDRLTAGRAGAY